MNTTIDFYNQNADAFISQTLSADMTGLYDPFLSRLCPDGSILDFGCGSGRDSKYFIEHGFQVDAIDGSAALCEKASNLIHQEVRCVSFLDYIPVKKYDGIWACASLLHSSKPDLEKIFNILSNSLKPTGLLYASFKYGEFEGIRNGRYFTDLKEDSLSQIIGSIKNLHLVETRITDDVRAGRESEKWLNAYIIKS